MSRIQSGKELRKKCQEILGPENGEHYYALYNEVCWLYATWGEYEILFASKPSRVKLLNKTAGYFFFIVQRVMLDDILLRICRITDPIKTGKNANLTIQIWAKNADFEREISEAQEKVTPCRVLRNKRIAHNDLKTIVDQVPTLEIDQIRDAIHAIGSVVMKMNIRWFKAELSLSHLIVNRNALELLYVLDDGITLEKLRIESIKRGECSGMLHNERHL
jgi:hypothetical protein